MGKNFPRAATLALALALVATFVGCAPSAQPNGSQSPAAASSPESSSEATGPAGPVSAEELGVEEWPLLADVDWAPPAAEVAGYSPEEIKSLGEVLSRWVKTSVTDKRIWSAKDGTSAVRAASKSLPARVGAYYREWESDGFKSDGDNPISAGVSFKKGVEVIEDETRVAIGWSFEKAKLWDDEPDVGLHASASIRAAFLLSEGGADPQWMFIHLHRMLAATDPLNLATNSLYTFNRSSNAVLVDVCQYDKIKRFAPAVYPSIQGEEAPVDAERQDAYAEIITILTDGAPGEYVSHEEFSEAMDRAEPLIVSEPTCREGDDD